METAASTQTRESVTKFSDKCKDFRLAKAEILNIINLRPSSDVELTPVCVLLVPNLTYHWVQSLMIVATFCRSQRSLMNEKSTQKGYQRQCRSCYRLFLLWKLRKKTSKRKQRTMNNPNMATAVLTFEFISFLFSVCKSITLRHYMKPFKPIHSCFETAYHPHRYRVTFS